MYKLKLKKNLALAFLISSILFLSVFAAIDFVFAQTAPSDCETFSECDGKCNTAFPESFCDPVYHNGKYSHSVCGYRTEQYYACRKTCVGKPTECARPACPANSSYSNGQCNCNAGYWMFKDMACVTKDEWCGRTYGYNSHEANGECPCDAGYTFLNGACVTDNEWCKATYGEGYFREGNLCASKSQPAQGQTSPKTIINIQKTPATQPSQKTQSAKKTPPPRKLTNQEMLARVKLWEGVLEYDHKDAQQSVEAMWDMLAAAMGRPTRAMLNQRAKIKRDAADKEFKEAARDGRIRNSATRENIRKMYYDSWLDNPLDKKTEMMMAVFEKDKGNRDTADVFEKFAYMNLGQKERNTLAAAVNRARESMGEKLMREEVNRTLLKKQLDASSFMNQLRQNVNDAIGEAKETAKDACYGVSACDWAWAKKVGIITEAQKLSREVREVMNEPIKKTFGFDWGATIKSLYGK
ncbi:MAG: hypothetical protein AAB797_01305 [Patescibacteria group bacterium]